VAVCADPGLGTLLDYRYRRHYKAGSGGAGGGNGRTGKNGETVELRLPVGTQVRDAGTGVLIADLTHEGRRVVVARGGQGGRGNARFVSSTHQTPRFAEKGEPGEERELLLELKLIADVGLVGFPNVGKSTLISRISAARPKIADYPFTTLQPNLGVVEVEPGKTFVVADIPGLIEGASEGAGLGHQFLRHVERTRLLVHVLDLSPETMREPHEDFEVVNRELAAHSAALAARPQVVALNKIDMPGAAERAEAFLRRLEEEGLEVHRVSALTGEGLRPLVYALWRRLETLPRPQPETGEEIVRYTLREDRAWDARRDGDVFLVSGKGVERLVAMTDLDSEAGVRRLQRILERMGVVGRLRDLGARDGDLVRIGRTEFDFID
jgi:GTP-binding protein